MDTNNTMASKRIFSQIEQIEQIKDNEKWLWEIGIWQCVIIDLEEKK